MKSLARERDKTEILRRLKNVRAESVRRWGRMSAHQMVCHLSDSFLMATGQKPASDMASLLDETILKWIVLYVPLRWPAGIETSPEIDQERGGTKPVDFDADLAQLQVLVERVTADIGTGDRRRHPKFGAMSRAAWLRWAYLHTDHHLRQFGA